jgi:hypothetical protein
VAIPVTLMDIPKLDDIMVKLETVGMELLLLILATAITLSLLVGKPEA